MRSDDIVGYTYNADVYCDDCIREIAKRGTLAAGSATMWADCGTAEEILTEWALLIGLDRMYEWSFDSGDFPKVIFADQVHDGCSADNGYEPGRCRDRCATCHEPLGFDCPNTEREGD